MRARVLRRIAERQRANAALCRLPLTEYLLLSRAERRRRLVVARLPKCLDVGPTGRSCDLPAGHDLPHASPSGNTTWGPIHG